MVIKTEKPNMLGIKVLWLLQAFRCCLSLFTNARRHLSRDILCRPYFQEKIADLYTFVALVIMASAILNKEFIKHFCGPRQYDGIIIIDYIHLRLYIRIKHWNHP